MAIKYDANLNNEIRRTVANFNKKVNRLEKQERELLPEKVSVKDLKREFRNRRELLRELKKLQSFSEKGVEDIITTEGGLRLTKYELANLKREKARASRRLTREIRQQQQAKTSLQITRASRLELLKHRKDILNRSITDTTGSELNSLLRMIKEQSKITKKNETFYRNYFDMLFKDAKAIGYDRERLTDLERTLRELTPEQLYTLEENDGAIRAILDYYAGEDLGFMEKNSSSIEGALDSLYERRNSLTNLFE